LCGVWILEREREVQELPPGGGKLKQVGACQLSLNLSDFCPPRREASVFVHSPVGIV
jgi:hypothetical protein